MYTPSLNKALLRLLSVLVLCFVGIGYAKSTPRGADLQSQNHHVYRLGVQWQTIRMLQNELAQVEEALKETRDLQLFPQQVTHLTDEAVVTFDRRIEAIEKRTRTVRQDLARLHPELADAVAITSEMVSGKPVQEMFEVLEQGDRRRIQEMAKIKYRIDSLWLRSDGMLRGLATTLGITLPVTDFPNAHADTLYSDLLETNMEIHAAHYVTRIGWLKDSLVRRADPVHIERMYRVDMHRLRQMNESGKPELVNRRAPEVVARYEKHVSIVDLQVLRIGALFARREYHQVLALLDEIPHTPELAETTCSYRMQSLFALGRTSDVLTWAHNYDFGSLSRANRNHLLWMSMESMLAAGKLDSMVSFASRADLDGPYLLQVMHALMRSFILKNDLPTALAVAERALRRAPATEQDKMLHDQFRLSSAHLHYEMENTQRAILGYLEMMKRPGYFEDALLGLSWCYIKSDEYDKAEASLRTLINQSPVSPRAVEAILLLGTRLVKKAHYEWQRLLHLSREEVRLARTVSELESKQAAVSDSVSLRTLNEALTAARALANQVKRQPRSHTDTIAALFSRAEGVCATIPRYYETGSLRDTRMSQERERLMQILDSLQISLRTPDRAGQTQAALGSFRRNSDEIRALVARSRLLHNEILLNRARWEGENLEWLKKTVNDKLSSIASLGKGNAGAQDMRSVQRQRGSLQKVMDSLVAVGESMETRWGARLISRLTKQLEAPLQPDDESYLRYHVGELLYERENRRFRQEYATYEASVARYDSLLALFRQGAIVGLPEKPIRPALDHRASIHQYQSVLSRFPDVFCAPAVHYSMAWCYSDMGLHDSALSHMSIVAAGFPESKYAPQAWMYLGEHAFDRGDLAEAVDAYQAVMRYPAGDWFDEALYKYAWTQYRLSNPEKAISSFLTLVDIGKSSGLGRSLLEKESMDYIAISFSEADISGQKGLSRAARFVERFGDIDRGTMILQRLAEVYREQGRLDMAEKTYRAMIEKYPTHARIPVIERGMLKVIEKRTSPSEMNLKLVEFFEKYYRSGAWASRQRDSVARTLGDSLAQQALYEAALGYHQEALQHHDTSLYMHAVSSYEKFIRAYPTSLQANECHYNLAEIQFSLGNYVQAAEEYMAVSKRYPDSKYREIAAWNAIVSAQNLVKLKGGTRHD